MERLCAAATATAAPAPPSRLRRAAHATAVVDPHAKPSPSSSSPASSSFSPLSSGSVLDRFIELPKEIVQRVVSSQPSLLNNLSVACTRCGRWIPVEPVDHIPSVAALQVPVESVLLRDAVSAHDLPDVLLRRSSRLASRFGGSSSSSAEPGSSSQQGGGSSSCQKSVVGVGAFDPIAKWYIPNPQCFTCNWAYCIEGDEDFMAFAETMVPPEVPTDSISKRRVGMRTFQEDGPHHCYPQVAQCCLCQKWRRVRRPHPGVNSFCCALSPYAETRSCSAPEDMEWLSDSLLSTEKLKAALGRRAKRVVKYLDPKHIRESRQSLHKQRINIMPSPPPSQAAASGKQRESAIDVDVAETIGVGRRVKAHGGDSSTPPAESSSRRGGYRRSNAAHNQKEEEEPIIVKEEKTLSRGGWPKPRRTTSEDASSKNVKECAESPRMKQSRSLNVVKVEESSDDEKKSHSVVRRQPTSKRGGSRTVKEEVEPDDEIESSLNASGVTVAARRKTGRRSARTEDEEKEEGDEREMEQQRTNWVQCGKCDRWRVVVKKPTVRALRHWECKHRTDIPTSCDDPDEAEMEDVMLERLGLV